MIADIKQTEEGYIAHYERRIEQPVERVWAMLTDNRELAKWFQELRVGEPSKGGCMKFDMGDGKFKALEIFEYSPFSVLAFDWFGDSVRFELQSVQDGCVVVFQERFTTITKQTAKDLAGWHVCLIVIESLLVGQQLDSRKEEWEKWFEQYERVFHELTLAD